MSIYSDRIEFHSRMVVKEILIDVMNFGLRGDQHFYICFNVSCMGVDMPEHVLSKHTNESKMVIVIRKNEFENLLVEDQGFFVELGFDGTAERVFIPFTSIISFVDPSQNFSLSFCPRHKLHSLSYETITDYIGNIENYIADNILKFPQSTSRNLG